MTDTIGRGSHVFVGGKIMAFGTVLGEDRFAGDVEAHWVVEMKSGERVHATPKNLIDCTQLLALSPLHLSQGGRA